MPGEQCEDFTLATNTLNDLDKISGHCKLNFITGILKLSAIAVIYCNTRIHTFKGTVEPQGTRQS